MMSACDRLPLLGFLALQQLLWSVHHPHLPEVQSMLLGSPSFVQLPFPHPWSLRRSTIIKNLDSSFTTLLMSTLNPCSTRISSASTRSRHLSTKGLENLRSMLTR